jgi:hypothetical protein
MSIKSDIPFNIQILKIDNNTFAGVKPVTSGDSFDGATRNFAEDGLYSVSIFGRVGDDARDRRFSYIDIRVGVLHPIIWRALGKLKQLYHDILFGQAYAVFDPAVKDFVRSDMTNGKTGYQFFIEHADKIEFQKTNSTERDFNIRVVKKYWKIATTSKVVVEPAGLRDIQLSADGRHEEDAVNDLYRRLLAISNTVAMHSLKGDPEILDHTRVLLQKTFNAIYEHFEGMLRGKRKLVQNKWASRRIQNGTRNVITAMNTSVMELGAEGNIGVNHTGIGLYQYCKAVMPLAWHQLRSGLLSKVFSLPNLPARLTDVKNLEVVDANVTTTTFDKFMTNVGLEKLIKTFNQRDVRHRPMMVEGHYLGLIYKDERQAIRNLDGTIEKNYKVFKVFQDIRDLPTGWDRNKVTPLTFAEWLYIEMYQKSKEIPLFVTRYPVASAQSIYPSLAYLMSTVVSEHRYPLDDEWNLILDQKAYTFPIFNEAFVNSLIPHSSRLLLLTADFDGDTSSANALMSDEGIREIRERLKTRAAYVGTDGEFYASAATDTVNLVLHNMTGSAD